MTVYVNGVNDIPGLLPDVIGMGAGDAVYLLEKKGYKTKMNGFGRVFRQSPLPGSPAIKGDLVTLELGFDELEIFRKDSIANADSIQGPVLSMVPIGPKPKKEEPKVTQAASQPAAVKPVATKPPAKVSTKKAPVKKKKTTKKNTTKPKK
jgi:hypothetical protein